MIQTLPYRYTKTERKKLLKSMVILVDTREQKDRHITDYFDNKDIPYKSKKLDYGDYSFYLPEQPELGIQRGIYFSDDIAIERKNSLEEVSNCFTQNRQRFENELIKSQGAGSKLILLIEDPQGYKNIVNGRYRTQYNKKSFLGTLMSFMHRYNMNVNFIDPTYSGNFIYYTMYYWLREYLK